MALPRSRLSRNVALAFVCALASLTSAAAEPPEAASFYLRDGDRVVFYGDSITEQAHYTRPIELYVRTRLPDLKMSFVNSGWGGDRAWGGDGGMLEERLKRDVVAHKPTVVTVMLGMNDGYYTDFSDDGLSAFKERIETLIATLERELPGVRITLIGSSPYDNVTPGEQPEWERKIVGGYNGVVARYAAGMRDVAERHKLAFVDMNQPLVDAIQEVQAADATLAREMIPDRIHPGPAAGLLMAAQLLDAWHAPQREHVTQVNAAGAESAVMKVRQALPLPYPVDRSDPLTKKLVELAPAMSVFAGDTLRVDWLKTPRGLVEIDGDRLGSFSRDELAAGIDLAPPGSPLAERAREIAELVDVHDRLQFARWRRVELANKEQKASDSRPLRDELTALENRLDELTNAAAGLTPHSIGITGVSE
ncbi:MAG: SGNH/GDSL hydrolase family protein [Pirellulales bacterium]